MLLIHATTQVISLNVRSSIPKDLPDSFLQSLTHPADKVVLPALEPTLSVDADGNGEGTEPLTKKSKKKNSKQGNTITTITSTSTTTRSILYKLLICYYTYNNYY